MSSPPPPNFYQSRQAYWGNPYSAADTDSDDDSDDMPAAAPNSTVAVAGLTTKATEADAVVADAVDASDVITDEYAPIADATLIDAHIDVEHAVIAAVGALPAANNNCTTTPYNNLMSASRRESAGRSVEPSSVNGINNQHEMWIRQCMKDDWGIQYPHEFQIRAIHHIAFQRDQILYIVARTVAVVAVVAIVAVVAVVDVIAVAGLSGTNDDDRRPVDVGRGGQIRAIP
jgi:hypothetical protein